MILTYQHIKTNTTKEFYEIKKELDSYNRKSNVCFYEKELSNRTDGTQILEYAKNKALRIKIISDGKIFSNQEVANLYLRSGAHIFEIEFDLNKDLKETIRGFQNIKKSGFFNKFRKTIKAFVAVKILITKQDKKIVSSIVKQILPLEPDRIILKNQQPKTNLISKNFFKEIIDTCIQNNIWILTENVPINLMKGYEPHIIELYEMKND
ncbi:MAG: hypothetical protein ABIC91_01505 [Nanoarchaeota archaeon]|nr:hypothetical protein [Nanoarchaeota archaeon]